MADKAYCVICDSYTSTILRGLREEGECPYCHTSEEILKVISDAREVLYDGYGESVEVPDSPLITLAIKLVRDNHKLEAQNRNFIQAYHTMRSGMSQAGRLVHGLD